MIKIAKVNKQKITSIN